MEIDIFLLYLTMSKNNKPDPDTSQDYLRKLEQ